MKSTSYAIGYLDGLAAAERVCAAILPTIERARIEELRMTFIEDNGTLLDSEDDE